MKRVFLDTNILMDAAEGREHGDEANAEFSYLPIMTAKEFLTELT